MFVWLVVYVTCCGLVAVSWSFLCCLLFAFVFILRGWVDALMVLLV